MVIILPSDDVSTPVDQLSLMSDVTCSAVGSDAKAMYGFEVLAPWSVGGEVCMVSESVESRSDGLYDGLYVAVARLGLVPLDPEIRGILLIGSPHRLIGFREIGKAGILFAVAANVVPP